MTTADWALVTSTFVASFVECVEALTIVLAMGITRGWRAALAGVATALVALAAFTVVAGYALASWVPTAALQLVVGTLMLIFGLQWLRKAILRSSGHKALHDEEAEYAAQTAAGTRADDQTIMGLDAFGYLVSLKGVFLEGVEVTFIVLTFGLNADNVPLATGAGMSAAAVVTVLGLALHRPLSAVPENTLKYIVGLLLTTYGTFWSMEGLGALTAAQHSLSWWHGDWALVGLLLMWIAVSRGLIMWLRADSARHQPAQVGASS